MPKYKTPVGEQQGTLGATGSQLIKPESNGVAAAEQACEIVVQNQGTSGNSLVFQRAVATNGEGIEIADGDVYVEEFSDSTDDVWELYSTSGTDYLVQFKEYTD